MNHHSPPIGSHRHRDRRSRTEEQQTEQSAPAAAPFVPLRGENFRPPLVHIPVSDVVLCCAMLCDVIRPEVTQKGRLCSRLAAASSSQTAAQTPFLRDFGAAERLHPA